MSIENCLISAMEQGEISDREAAFIKNIYDGYRKKAAGSGTADDDLQAQAKTARRLAEDAVEKKRRTLLQAKAQKTVVADTLAYRTATGKADIGEGTIALLEHYGTAPFQSVEGLRKVIVGQAHAQLSELLQKFERTAFLGKTPNKADMKNIVRELFGESTGDPAAKAMAEAWDQVSDGLRQRFNRAGGAIGKLENWGLPQVHDAKALLRAGKDEWKQAIRNRLDLSRMRHPVTGDEILDFEIDGILDRVWGDIVTNGWASREPSQAPVGRGAIAGQHAEHRFLVFKSADDWLEYQRAFGQGDPFASMMNHINGMARDIAAIERLGPNPQAMLTFLKQRIEKAGQARKTGAKAKVGSSVSAEPSLQAGMTRVYHSGSAGEGATGRWVSTNRTYASDYRSDLPFYYLDLPKDDPRLNNPDYPDQGVDQGFTFNFELNPGEAAKLKEISRGADTEEAVPFAGWQARADSRARGKIAAIDNMWEAYRGNAEVAVDTHMASGFSVTRNWLTASILGSAILSAIPTDPIYQMLARRFVGIPALGTLRDLAGEMRKGGRMESVRAGLILDSAMHTFGTQARYLGTLSGPEWSQVLPDRVLAWQGLTAWTQAGRHAFGKSFQGMLADRTGKSLAELRAAKSGTLEKATGNALERWGFTAEDWDKIRGAALHSRDRATFLRPQEIAAVDERLAERVLEMILQETEYAVPSGTLRGRAFSRFGTRPGTLWGEVVRSAGMFKSFAVTYALLYGSRIWREFGRSRAAGAGYAGAILLTTSIGGAMSLWLKDIAAGRDPRPILGKDGNPMGFAGQAMMQGGGFGIFGDFILGDLNRFGGGIGQAIGGPIADTATDLVNLTVGNAVQLATGDTTNAAEEARKFIAKNTPGRSLWFLRLAYDRWLMDNMRRLTDPKAEKAFRRRGRYVSDLGTDTWWAPGQGLPARPPELDVLRPGS